MFVMTRPKPVTKWKAIITMRAVEGDLKPKEQTLLKGSAAKTTLLTSVRSFLRIARR